MGIRTIYTYVCLIDSAHKAIARQYPDLVESILKNTRAESCHDIDYLYDDVTSERERAKVCRDILSLSHVANRVHSINVKNTSDMAAKLEG